MISKNVNRVCSEIDKVENYQQAVNDQSQVWDLHHRAEILPCGYYSAADLKAANLYYNRPPEELIFLTRKDHSILHGKNPFVNKKKSKSHVGDKNSQYGKKGALHPVFGYHWYNDGRHEVFAKECPPDHVPGRLLTKEKVEW